MHTPRRSGPFHSARPPSSARRRSASQITGAYILFSEHDVSPPFPISLCLFLKRQRMSRGCMRSRLSGERKDWAVAGPETRRDKRGVARARKRRGRDGPYNVPLINEARLSVSLTSSLRLGSFFSSMCSAFSFSSADTKTRRRAPRAGTCAPILGGTHFSTSSPSALNHFPPRYHSMKNFY